MLFLDKQPCKTLRSQKTETPENSRCAYFRLEYKNTTRYCVDQKFYWKARAIAQEHLSKIKLWTDYRLYVQYINMLGFLHASRVWERYGTREYQLYSRPEKVNTQIRTTSPVLGKESSLYSVHTGSFIIKTNSLIASISVSNFVHGSCESDFAPLFVDHACTL